MEKKTCKKLDRTAYKRKTFKNWRKEEQNTIN